MDTTPSPDDLLLIHEVATITRRSVDTLRWLRHKGEGPRGHRAGRRVYFRRGDVAAWLASRSARALTPAPPPDLPPVSLPRAFPHLRMFAVPRPRRKPRRHLGPNPNQETFAVDRGVDWMQENFQHG